MALDIPILKHFRVHLKFIKSMFIKYICVVLNHSATKIMVLNSMLVNRFSPGQDASLLQNNHFIKSMQSDHICLMTGPAYFPGRGRDIESTWIHC